MATEQTIDPTPASTPAASPPPPRRGGFLSVLKKVFLVLAAIIVVFAIVVSTRPADYKISRSATIDAPVSVVFEQVNDFHHWNAWSPWAKLDPAAKNTFEGPESGTGAVFTWSGNNEIGAGKMTLTESRPNELIAIKLQFIRPFEDQGDVEFTFQPESDHTVITWSMSGHQNFIGKAVCMFMNMDKMLGGDFERGLAQIKVIAEAEAHKK